MNVLRQPAQSRTRECAVSRLAHDKLHERGSIGFAEFHPKVSEQSLCDKLQKNVVVSLEGRINVEVRTKTHEPVLGEESLPATRFTTLLNGVERLPRREWLERSRKRLEILAVIVRVMASAKYGIELFQQFPVRKRCGIGAGDARDQTALVALVVEQYLLTAVWSIKLPALISVRDCNLKRNLHGIHTRAVERNTALNQCAEHGEEASSRAGNW